MSALAITKQDEETVTALANLAADLMLASGIGIAEATRLAVAEFTKVHDRWLGIIGDHEVQNAFAERMWWKVNGGKVAA